ncbi:MAG: cell envelope integrity protein TolA [Burkholderiaceae bacterium]|jgi:colicin import membrane protein|nr:cell envelope integrity protein TolA [Burkholderiaceae bacterium]
MAEPAMNQSATSRASFDPPPPRGLGRAFTLALLIHLLLVLALAWGLRWKKDAQDEAVDAELWAATAQTAAPRPARVQPPPPPPTPVTPPTPTPPPPKPVPQVNDDQARQAELALEQQKKRDQEQQEEQRQRQIAAAKAKAAQQQAAAKAKAAQQAAAEANKAAAQKAQAEQQAKADDARRETNLRNLKALASADQVGITTPSTTGRNRTTNGNASRSAGPSADYSRRVGTLIHNNLAFSALSSIRGDPCVVVDIYVETDGTITGNRVVKPSGVSSWDSAVKNAIVKTQILPHDVYGRIYSPIELTSCPH